MMQRMKRLSLYAHTIKRLKLSQVAHQLLYLLGTWKTYRVTDTIPEPLPAMGVMMAASDRDPVYLDRFDLEALHQSRIILLHQEYPFPWGNWSVDGASSLFQFNLHYHEFLIPLALRYKERGNPEDLHLFVRIVEDWLDTCCKTPYASGKYAMPQSWYNAWAPYTISLRAVNWLVCLDLVGVFLPQSIRDSMNRALYIQYLHLFNNLEKRVLANHYFENLKTLYILSLYFRDDIRHARAWKMFSSQLKEQVLSSGLHMERSLMYHRLLLEGLLRCLQATRTAGKEPPDLLHETVVRMLSYSAQMEKGFHRTPLFNDAGDNVAKSLPTLLQAAESLGIVPREYVQKEEPGYHVLVVPHVDARLMVDADVLGPNYMSGHGHNDCLSFELAVQGLPLFVNSGTYQYQGPMRGYFRSTAAHNTAMVQGVEQAQCWGEHRVARTIKDVDVEKTETGLLASYRTWTGIRHERRFDVKSMELSVVDIFDVKDVEILSYLRIAPNADLIRQKDGGFLVVVNGEEICSIYSLQEPPSLFSDDYSPEFGLLLKAHTLLFSWKASKGSGGYRIIFLKDLKSG